MLSIIFAEDLISRVREAINIKEKIAIVSHVGPDGDAIGSSLALWHYLEGLGKETNIIVPTAFPGFLSWMPGAKNIIVYEHAKAQAQEVLEAADLIFALDFNTTKRLEKMEKAVVNTKAPKILIDHHLFPENFAQIIISYPEISSTSELIFRTICRMGHFEHISLECGQCILTGMMTDTGGFAYNSNHPEIYTIVAELIKLGVDKDDIYRKVFNNNSLGRTKLNAFAIYRKMKLFPNNKAALITITQDELERFDYKPGDTEGIVNVPLSIDGVIFSVLMREDTDKIKISFRSQGTFPANKFAAEIFNGGGHLNAAGGESYTTLKEAVSIFTKALPNYVNYLEISDEDSESNM